MRIPIIIPDSLFSEERLRLGEWLVDVGDSVDAGECLAELICPGLAIDLPAPASGVIAELIRQPEHLVTAGEVLGWLETEP